MGLAIVSWQTHSGCQFEPPLARLPCNRLTGSGRGKRHDNGVAESCFHLLRPERIRRRTNLTRDAARQDVFDYIEMFYNPTCQHASTGMLSLNCLIAHRKMNAAGVQGTRGTSVDTEGLFIRRAVRGFILSAYDGRAMCHKT